MDRFSELQTLVAIVETGSLAGAARRLGRSPPAVTRILADLETRIGVVLIERTTRRSLPTEAGRHLADQARFLLNTYDNALSEAAGNATRSRGSIKMTGPLVFGREHVAPHVTSFLDIYPEITIDLHLADRIIDLHEEHFDLAVRIGRSTDTSLISRRIGEVSQVVVASPTYLAARGTPDTPCELTKHEIIQHTGQGASTPWVMRDGDGAPLIVNLVGRYAVNQADAAIAAARAGRGVVIALSYQVDADLRAGHLTRLLSRYEPDPLPVALVWPTSRKMLQRIRLLVEHLAVRLSNEPTLRRSK